jgi:A/G-specific adenine glycosylase
MRFPLSLHKNTVPLDYSTFSNKLSHWFAASQRDLPWREAHNARDAYRVLVSEVMLQQTTVAAVVPYYERFLQRFPDVKTLAAADMDEVLPFWAGLGYYLRARNLHAAARIVVEKHGGVFPHDIDEVLALPGIGRYTAGAILSIAFDERVPIVDANVARVLARVLCLDGDLKNNENQKRLWDEATRVVEASTHPAQTNPALMELGALICVPKTPRCGFCPVRKMCRGYRDGRQNALPFLPPKRADIAVHDACAFVRQGERILLRRRSDTATTKNWWRGLWELPRTTVQSDESEYDALARLFCEELNLSSEVAEKLETLRHTVTHHKITLDCFAVQLPDFSMPDNWNFFTFEEADNLALPSVMRRLLLRLHSRHVAAQQMPLWKREE